MWKLFKVVFLAFFLSFSDSGKAFKTRATSWGFEGSPRFYLSEEQMLKREERQRQLNPDLWKGRVLGPAGPWSTSPGLCQSLSCCSSAESDPTASAKAKRICVTAGLLRLCRQKLDVLCSSPAEQGSSSPPLFFQTLVPSPLFCQHHLPQQQRGWSRCVEWCHCSGAFAAIKALLFHKEYKPQKWRTMRRLTVCYHLLLRSVITEDVRGKNSKNGSRER